MPDRPNTDAPAIDLDDLRPRPTKASLPRRPAVLVFDPRQCNGCGECVTACAERRAAKNPGAGAAIRILAPETEGGRHFAIFCQHCREPLCLPVCPTRAIEKGPDGIVRINRRFCTDCGLCALACPESAPLKNMQTGRIDKCDLCDGAPACAQRCTEGALKFTRGKAFGWIRLIRWPVQALSFFFLVMVFVGTFCHFRAGLVNLECPTGFLQNLFSSKVLWWTGLGSAAVLLGLTVVLGRVFCGWICPFGFVLDLVSKVTPRFGLPRFLKSRTIKYGVLASAVGTSAGLGFQPFCTICPIGSLCRSYGPNGILNGAQLAIVPAFAALEAGERRGWCRYFCPVGALLALAARFGLIKIVIGARQCKKFSCMQCADICPAGIIDRGDLQQGISPEIPMAECIMCLRCVDKCPYGAAKIRFRWQKTAPEDVAAPLLRQAAGGRQG